jgi:hypothetical protein
MKPYKFSYKNKGEAILIEEHQNGLILVCFFVKNVTHVFFVSGIFPSLFELKTEGKSCVKMVDKN